jgi:hypothetical protein
LRGQRIRWHVGLLDSLKLHKRLTGNPRFGVVGLVSTPQSILFEVLSPPLMALGCLCFLLSLWYRELSWQLVAGFLVLVLINGQAETAAALVIEEVGFHRYRSTDLLKMAGWSLLEGFWFRPLISWWRLKATAPRAIQQAARLGQHPPRRRTRHITPRDPGSTPTGEPR